MATKVGEITDAKGTWDVFENGSRELRVISAQYQAELDAGSAALTAAKAVETANATMRKALAMRAQKYAEDPIANAASKLTDRELHELVAISNGLTVEK